MPRYALIATRLILSLSLCFSLSSLATAEIYKTIDKNGSITYTDVPPTNTAAKPVELKTINSLPSPPAMPNVSPSNSGANQATPGYKIQVTAPENGTTIMADERSVTVSVSLNQNLQDGDILAYKIDGDTLTTTQELTYTIIEPPRGEHSLTVDVVSRDGKSLAQSDAITLLVMRPLAKPKATPRPTK